MLRQPKPPPAIPPAPLGAQPIALPKGEALQRPQDDAARIDPFYACDAWVYHPVFNLGTLNCAPQGYQLVTYHYVPEGRTGFIKQIRICPYLPPAFAAIYSPWVPDYLGYPIRPNPVTGYWQTPAGWEAMFDPSVDPQLHRANMPKWSWTLQFLAGDIDQIKRENQIPDFDVDNPVSWYLASPYPVPAQAYPGGRLPGSVILGPNKLQRIGSEEEGSLHIVVPEDTTVLLWCRWIQHSIIAPRLITYEGEVPVTVVLNGEIYPILPSFGALIGYEQPNNKAVTGSNAREGWGG